MSPTPGLNISVRAPSSDCRHSIYLCVAGCVRYGISLACRDWVWVCMLCRLRRLLLLVVVVVVVMVIVMVRCQMAG